MQIPAARLHDHLAKGLRSIYALHGDEPLLQQEAADLIRQTARAQGFTERQVFTVVGAHFDWGEEGVRSLQFFADRVEGNLLAAHQEMQKLALLYPPGELSWDQIERAVLNVARYDVFKLTESVLAGQPARVQRMIDGLRAEGVSEVLVHYTLAEDIRSLKRVKEALSAGRPLPQAMREQRVWGPKERLFERVLPRLSLSVLERLLQGAHQVDGVVKGMRSPDWPPDPWQALGRLAQGFCKACTSGG